MISCIINGKKRSFDIDPTKRLREMLLMNGNFAVRDSDDAEGFCGSDTVLLNGTPVFSNLVLAGEAEGFRGTAGLLEIGAVLHLQHNSGILDSGTVRLDPDLVSRTKCFRAGAQE